MINIRKIREADAAAFLSLCRRLDEETDFMMLERGERQTSLEEQIQQIKQISLRENQTILVAEAGGELIECLGAFGGDFNRNQHCVYVFAGVLQTHSGQRVGKMLFSELEAWARRQKIHRLELTVMTHNERAIRLYKRMGFEIEGTKKASLFVNGFFVDEYYMAKLLV